MRIDLFSAQAATKSIAVTSTASASTALPGNGNTLRIVNEGTVPVYISVGAGAQVATIPTSTGANTCTPCMPGETFFSIPADSRLNISAICSATATLQVSVGEGS